MTEEEKKNEELLQQKNIISSPVVLQKTVDKIQVTSPLSQITQKNPSFLHSTAHSRQRLKDNRSLYPSSMNYFDNNLNKCYENLYYLKEKVKGLNHSNTQKLFNNQMFSSQIQKCKEDYSKLKPSQLAFQSEPPIYQEQTHYLTEEAESCYVSNQILNKTNVDLKNQLKSMENQFEYNRSIQSNIKDMSNNIDNLKIELINANKTKNELFSTITMLDTKVGLLTKDNTILHDKLEEITNAYNIILNEKRNYDMIINKLQNENEAMNNSQIYKEKEYGTLISKLSLSEEMMQNMKKTKVDYEELIEKMEKTIQILTNSNMNQAIVEMKSIIQEKDLIIQSNNSLINQLQSKLNQYDQKGNQHLNQSNNRPFASNEVIDLNSKLKNEIDILSYKTHQLYQIIKDKDSLIQQLKDNYSFLNSSLVITQKKQENVLSELKSLGILTNKNSNTKNQMRFSDSKALLFNHVKENAEEINNMLISATNCAYKYDNNKLKHLQNDSMNRKELQMSYDGNNYNSKQSNDLSMNYNQITYENEQLKTENRLLRSECEVANKNFNQILNNQSNIYLGTTGSQQTEKIITTNNNLNTEFNQVINNNICLYRIYDSKRILRFDLAQKDYQIVEFIDYNAFDKNYILKGSIVLNTLDGFFVLTGENNDMLYYYNNEKVTMTKVTKFAYNHSHGALILDELKSSIIALSGWNNVKVERYINPKLILSQSTSNNEKTTEMTLLPDMTIERSESGYLLYNNDTVFAFFGYCYPKAQYIDTIEYLLLNPGSQNVKSEWQRVNYHLNDSNTNTLIKGHGIAIINEDEVLILGGFNGLTQTSVEKLLRFDIKTQSLEEINRKLPNIDINHCYNFEKESQFINYEDENNNIFLGNIDEMDNVHIIETSSLNYDLFKFD